MVFVCTLDVILELAPIVGKLFGHLVNPAWHVATDCGREGHALTDMKFMQGHRAPLFVDQHQFGTSMPQGGHPPHHSITSSARCQAQVLRRPQVVSTRAAGLLDKQEVQGLMLAIGRWPGPHRSAHCEPIRIEAGWPGSLKRLPVSVTFVPSSLRMEISWSR